MAVCSLYENSEGKKSGPNFEASDGAESQISRENRVLRDDTEASGTFPRPLASRNAARHCRAKTRVSRRQSGDERSHLSGVRAVPVDRRR